MFFPKYKIRLIKRKFIDDEELCMAIGLLIAEWSNESRTYVGTFIKKFYLDEIPNFEMFLGVICRLLDLDL